MVNRGYPASVPLDGERELVARAQTGDEAAFARLYDAYFSRVYRYILTRTSHEADAEDLAAEVFIKVVDALPAFRWQEAPFSAWLFRIARNCVISHHRRNGARPVMSKLPQGQAVKGPDPEELAEQRLTVMEVWQAASRLTEAQRQVIELRFAAGLSVAETARVLGKSESNIKVTQHNAIARLKQMLNPGSGKKSRKQAL